MLRSDARAHQGQREGAATPRCGTGPAYSSVSFLLSSMKAIEDSDLRRLVTSYVRSVTPKMSSW